MTTSTISETVSEKRGRPTVFDPEYVRGIGRMYPEITSQRGLIAKCYEIDAVSSLTNGGNGWIEGVSRIVGDKIYSSTILEQLGRLKNETDCGDAVIVRFAREVNQLFIDDASMTVRRAVQILRVLRAQCRETVDA